MMKSKKLRNKTKRILSISVIGIAICCVQPKAKAFVPYFFEPNQESLQETSINFGKTAAKYIHYGQIKEGLHIAELAVKLNPNDEILWTILAEAQIRNELINEANKSLDKAKTINPQNASLWFAQGSLALRQKKINQSVKLINKGLELDPNNASRYFQLGNARIMQMKKKLALKAFQKATKIQPNFWEALNNQGLVIFELGHTKKAISIWKKVLEINNNAEPMLALAAALTLLEPGNNESIQLAKDALAKNPNYVSTSYQSDQLWGIKLQKATKKLLSMSELSLDVERAFANSD